MLTRLNSDRISVQENCAENGSNCAGLGIAADTEGHILYAVKENEFL